MLEFRLNRFIILRLIGNRTEIYVNEKKIYYYCSPLILMIDADTVDNYNEINSIDEIGGIQNDNFGKELKGLDIEITPEFF